jgi:hypothetical protein
LDFLVVVVVVYLLLWWKHKQLIWLIFYACFSDQKAEKITDKHLFRVFDRRAREFTNHLADFNFSTHFRSIFLSLLLVRVTIDESQIHWMYRK